MGFLSQCRQNVSRHSTWGPLGTFWKLLGARRQGS